MKFNYSLITKLILLTAVINFTGCSMFSSQDIASNTSNTTENTNKSDKPSLLTKKAYQNKLTSWLKPYKIDVQQGNIITSEMLNNLKVGMNKQQVRFILGTSILTESYKKNQWIYAFSDAAAGKTQKEQVLLLSFKNDKLYNIKENTIVN